MRKFCWSVLFVAIFFPLFFAASDSKAQPPKFTSSTQFLWGDDLLGESSAILAQYLRLQYTPENSKLAIAGYGRISYDFGHNNTYYEDQELLGRLYYLYVDIMPFDNSLIRLGRQYVSFSSGSSLMDGVSLSVNKLGPIGITAAAGRDIVYSLNSEYSASGNYVAGIDLHLDGVKNLQLGVSFAMKWDGSDIAREELGMNFRYVYKFLSPYAEIRYDLLSETFDLMTIGLDAYPAKDLLVKAEFYQSYPTFDSTSIYSVFAVDRYNEYLIRAEYSLATPVTVYASYVHQTYQESSNADNYILGARFYPTDKLSLNAAVEYRNGYGGNLWGFEVTGDYKIDKKFLLSAGAQYNSYRRLDFTDENYNSAQRYWIGAQYLINKNLSAVARIEDNINENFNNRWLGRVALNWNL